MTRIYPAAVVLACFVMAVVPSHAAAQECAGWAEFGPWVHLEDTEISESSGLAMSRVTTERLWTHNDSGDSSRLFLIDEGGETRATVMLGGIDARDWEDMDVGPCGPTGTAENARPCIYVGDIGDNLAVLDEVVIHRFSEPEIGPSTTTRVVSEIESLRVKYEDGARDAEALMVHPSGRIFIADKVEGGTVQIYEAPANFGSTVTAEIVATLELTETGPYSNLITAGTFSPDGTVAVLKSYGKLYTFCGSAQEPIELFRSEPTQSQAAPLLQGEALAYDADNSRLWLTSERIPSLFLYQPREGSTVDEDADAGGPADAGDVTDLGDAGDGADASNDSGDAEASPETNPTSGPEKEGCQTAGGRPESMTFLAALLLSFAIFRRGRPTARRRRNVSAPAS